MRNAQKQEVLGCVESLHQAHEEIKNALNMGNYSLVQNMLSQCQEFAVSLGENIEKLEGEGHATVACLEAYCETLYCVYGELGSDGAGSGKIYKKLRRQLLRVESSAKNDIRVRKEVVFLPYKASMWDSLESVWKAADEDPECDAYVIPIPYYDKKPDGSFGERHYEGGLYPEYVPVIPYENYDFENRRPDIIFIHNPYDENNYVTSVMPFFYSKNLRQFTDKLVYIPYFILEEIKPDDQQAVEGMKHFCLVPGVMNADRVIVQSEDMRQVYINVLVKALGEQTRKYWEQKILGLGSPKIDKVLNTKKEDLAVPDEWLQVIQKSDGSWKKIVFYNTSVSSLLENAEKKMDEMKHVFRIFEKHQGEMALLWRPHPLMRATIESMRPHLWEKYDKIVKYYKEESIGIYDDTADVERAVILSDVYYGDASSVVQLWQSVGKPIFFSNSEVPQNLLFYDAIEIKGEIWFSAINVDGLFKMNFLTKQVQLVCCFNEKLNYLHSKIFYHQGKLIFVPYQAKNIAVYDIDNKKMCTIQIPDCAVKYSHFTMALQEENIIYMVPCRYDRMIKFDVLNYKVESFNVIRDNKIYKWSVESPFVMKGACKVNHFIYLGCYSSDFIEKYDLKSGKIDYYNIPFEMKGVSHLLYGGDALWIIGNNGRICKWSETQGIQQIIDIEDAGKKVQAFYDAVLFENKIFLSGTISQNIYIVDIKTNNVRVAGVGKKVDKKYFEAFWANYTSLCKLNNKVVVMCALDGSMYEVDSIGRVEEICEMSYEIDNEQYIISLLDNQFIIGENKKGKADLSGEIIYRELTNGE